MNREQAVETLKELLEHGFTQASAASIRRTGVNHYSLVLKCRNSLFLTAFLSEKHLLLQEDKEKGICTISSP